MQVFLWKYKRPNRNQTGYHITGTERGLDHLASLLTAKQHPLTKTMTVDVKLTPATEHEVRVPNFSRPAVSFSRLAISVRLNDSSDLFRLSDKGGVTCYLDISQSRLPDLLEGFEDIKRGSGDYAISGEDCELWFWWRLGN